MNEFLAKKLFEREGEHLLRTMLSLRSVMGLESEGCPRAISEEDFDKSFSAIEIAVKEFAEKLNPDAFKGYNEKVSFISAQKMLLRKTASLFFSGMDETSSSAVISIDGVMYGVTLTYDENYLLDNIEGYLPTVEDLEDEIGLAIMEFRYADGINEDSVGGAYQSGYDLPFTTDFEGFNLDAYLTWEVI